MTEPAHTSPFLSDAQTQFEHHIQHCVAVQASFRLFGTTADSRQTSIQSGWWCASCAIALLEIRKTPVIIRDLSINTLSLSPVPTSEKHSTPFALLFTPAALVCLLTLAETKALTCQWLTEYNEIRPHGSLGGLSPLQFLGNFRSEKSIINKMKLPENQTLEVD